MLPPRRSSAAAVGFAWCGAAVFTFSLGFFAFSYLGRYGTSAAGTARAWRIGFNLILFTLFALHHSILARPAIKQAIRAAVGPPLERSLYVWTASLLFILVCALWQPVPGVLYSIPAPAGWLGYAAQLLGLIVTIRGSSRLDVLDLAGVRAFLDQRQGRRVEHVPLETTGLFGFVRHPLYFGWLLIVFGAPHMTLTRFVFAAISTLYLVVAIPLEERSLVRTFGQDYEAYRRKVRWRMLPGVY